MDILNKLKKDYPNINWDEVIDIEWGTYEIHRHVKSTNPKNYLLHAWDNNIWVYEIMPSSISTVATYSNKSVKDVKKILGD